VIELLFSESSYGWFSSIFYNIDVVVGGGKHSVYVLCYLARKCEWIFLPMHYFSAWLSYADFPMLTYFIQYHPSHQKRL